jgi:hypothetical protein
MFPRLIKHANGIGHTFLHTAGNHRSIVRFEENGGLVIAGENLDWQQFLDSGLDSWPSLFSKPNIGTVDQCLQIDHNLFFSI